ncbi:conserved hypothetical protein [Alteromonas macleodii]|tara:strand:- start:123 stop:485 length:363 start_codon:yes stop_codon:yes gene_type:complete
MASCRQKAKQSLDAFQAWVATQSNDDFKQMIHRGKLKRQELANATGCGKSALVQNSALREAIANLENTLRDKGVLPPVANQASNKSAEPREKAYDNTAKQKSLDSHRVALLEKENLELKA